MEPLKFAIVIDGEVAKNFSYPMDAPGAAMIDAILSSNPVFVKTTETPAEGSTYDGSTFTPPA